MTDTTFAANLRAARARAALSQTALGRLIDVGQGAITKWENGRNTPSVEQAIKLAAALGTTPAELLSGCEIKPAPLRTPAKATRTRTIRANRPPRPRPEPPAPGDSRIRSKARPTVF